MINIMTKSMSIIKVLMVVLAIIIFSNCATTVTTTASNHEEAKLSYITDSGVFHLAVIADLDVSQTKITGRVSGSSSEIQLLRVRAINNALATNNADVLLEPRFTYETIGFTTNVTVTGFPASYKNFRTITERDADLIDVNTKLLRSRTYTNE